MYSSGVSELRGVGLEFELDKLKLWRFIAIKRVLQAIYSLETYSFYFTIHSLHSPPRTFASKSI